LGVITSVFKSLFFTKIKVREFATNKDMELYIDTNEFKTKCEALGKKVQKPAHDIQAALKNGTISDLFQKQIT